MVGRMWRNESEWMRTGNQHTGRGSCYTIPTGAGPFKQLFKNPCTDAIGQGKCNQKKKRPPDQFLWKIDPDKQKQKQINRGPEKRISEKRQYRIQKRMGPFLVDESKNGSVCLDQWLKHTNSNIINRLCKRHTNPWIIDKFALLLKNMRKRLQLPPTGRWVLQLFFLFL